MLSRPKTAPLRAVDLGPLAIEIAHRPDGTISARSPFPLPAYADSVTARLDHWAMLAPQRIFLAERDQHGNWRTLTFAEAHRGARALGQALLDRGLDAQRPLVILSGNSIAHALLALAAMYVGIPYAPISPAYSLIARDFSKLKRITALLTPGLVFAEDGEAFAAAIGAAVPDDVERLFCRTGSGRDAGDFASLARTAPTPAVDVARAKIGGDTIAKILFTSGSMTAPKAVITTHRMLCANQTMIGEVLRFLREAPPVLVDWLPWHHSFGGNHNFGMALHHGGTLYIDRGRPTEAGIAETVRTLREIAPTLFFNVPKGFEMLLPHLAGDRALAENFFRSLQLNFFAGASLSDKAVAALDGIAASVCGARVAMISGFGATETSPSVLFRTDSGPSDPSRPYIGLPLPGNELKLVPIDGKYEARVKGPHVTPGYWRDGELTRGAFDEEGFYRLGDALRLADANRPQRGFVFEGRLGEDFKLACGTTVSTGPLRVRIMAEGAPFIRDVAVGGENRDGVIALIFPDLAACRDLAGDLSASAEAREILTHPTVRAKFHAILSSLAARAGGASERIWRAALLTEPASIDAGEITDKGTLNRRVVLKKRADLVAALYAGEDGPLFLSPEPADRREETVRPGTRTPARRPVAIGR